MELKRELVMKWTKGMLIALAVTGIALSAYLTLQSLDPHIPLNCPSTGIINCAKVTSSPYSRLLGVPVAGLGLLWFLAVLALGLGGGSLKEYLLPLWVMGAVFVGYLIFSEIFLIHAICVYCTATHICALVLVLPVAKLSAEPE